MKNRLKLLLLSIMFISLGLSFCSSEFKQFFLYNYITLSNWNNPFSSNKYYIDYTWDYSDLSWLCYVITTASSCSNFRIRSFNWTTNVIKNQLFFKNSNNWTLCSVCGDLWFTETDKYFIMYYPASSNNTPYSRLTIVDSNSYNYYYNISNWGLIPNVSFDTTCPTCPTSSINVLYNNDNSSTTINCNWDNVIQIDWLSTITATNKFTPYFNISYKDENNQSLIESYSKDILYISGSLFKKTYTWDNEWILNNQSTDCSSDSSFSWYLPSFNITWGIQDVTDSWNIFNNFAENWLTVLLSNIPNYIQYIILIMLLFFVLGFIRKFKRR